MRYNRLAVALLLLAGRASAQEASVEELIGKPDSAIQAQIQAISDALQKPGVDPRNPVDAVREAQTLKKQSDDQEVLRQLAIWVVTTKSVEDSHVLIAQMILRLLDFPPSVPIRVLASYLDADNCQLHDFANIWFNAHDKAEGADSRMRPVEPVNFGDYLAYVERKADRKEDVPAGFIKYIYGHSPGQALLVFAHASSRGNVTAQLQAIGKSVEARKRGEEPGAEQRKISQTLKNSVQAESKDRRDIGLAEQIVSNAIWLKQNKFDEQFQKALPEATDELAKLAKHDQWWARLYVAEIMRQHRELRQPEVLKQLIADGNSLVSEAAKSAH